MELGRRRTPTCDHEDGGAQKLDRQKVAGHIRTYVGYSQPEQPLDEDFGTVGSLSFLYGLAQMRKINSLERRRGGYFISKVGRE